MIAVLANSISFITLIISFAIGNLIIILTTPAGFLAIFTSITFFEYSTAKSIIKDMRKIDFKGALNYVKNHKINKPLSTYQLAAINTISEKRIVCVKEMSDNIGETINNTKKLMGDLVDKGYAINKINVNSEQTFCYAATDKKI